MLSVLILLILAWHFYIGYSRGIILQAYYLVASIVSLVVASRFTKRCGSLTLWIPFKSESRARVEFFSPMLIFLI